MGLRWWNRSTGLKFSHKNNKIYKQMLSNLQPNGQETFKNVSYSGRQRGGHIKR
eukprot:TRINITY_DN2095_c1_g1_i1.p1 TRINITY_DN2095_c1_g1~~TRINITY_DN2095_c1_g1_i1.p1  ORF type:complete len:54 (-),score=3.59 TRINITY_DN2095_c1_g1_i1:96-257(-)